MRLEGVVREWQRARNNTPDADVPAVDAEYALDAGLPVLAALHTLVARLERADRPINILPENFPESC